MARQPGFGSLAEAMSGFAALTGEPDGPPTLPPFGLADGIAALATSFAVTAALRSAEATGRGQVIDVAIIEPIMMMLGAQITTFDQLGTVQPRLGNRSVNNAPRNVYRTADGRVGRREHLVAVDRRAGDAPRRASRPDRRAVVRHRPAAGRARRRAGRGGRRRGSRRGPLAEVLAAFEEAEAAIGPVYDVRGVMSDPQYAAIGTVHTSTTTSSARSRCRTCCSACPRRPGSIRWAGRPHGADTAEVLAEIGVDRRPARRPARQRHRVSARLTDGRSSPGCTCRATGRNASTRRWRPAPNS